MWKHPQGDHPSWVIKESFSEGKVRLLMGHIVHISLLYSIPFVIVATSLGVILAKKSIHPIACLNTQLELLGPKGAAYRFIEAQAPDQVIKRRLQHRNGTTHEISDARLENFEMLTGAYEAPSQTRERNCLHIATDRSMTATIEETLKKLVLDGLGSTA